MTPRWRRHLESILEREGDVDAVVVFTVPMSAPPRHPDRAARAVRRARRLLRRRRADEPARVRRHGHRLQLLPRRRPVRVRPRALELGGRRSTGCASSARGARRRCSGEPTRSSSRRSRSRRSATSSSTATATSSAASGSRRLVGEPCAPSAGRRLRARRPRLPGRHRPRAADRRRAVQRLRRARSRRRASTCASRGARTRSVYASSSVPAVRARGVAARRSSRTRTRESSGGSSPGRELIVVADADEATAAYRELLDDPAQAEELGRRARERVLDEHTYRAPRAPAARAARPRRPGDARLTP